MPDRDDLDRLLDSALATYADPGSDGGLEQRVLASLESAREAGEGRGLRVSAWKWMPWAIALPVAASLLVWIGINRTPHAPFRGSEQPRLTSKNAPMSTSPEANAENHSSAANAPEASARRSVRPKLCPFKAEENGPCISEKREVANLPPVPKLDVFPTPQPLTAEEKALVSMVYGGSKAEREALQTPPAQSDAPLDIAALNVPPLASSSEGKN